MNNKEQKNKIYKIKSIDLKKLLHLIKIYKKRENLKPMLLINL